MEEKKTESATKNVKKVNLLDHNAIKHLLDESVSDVSHKHINQSPQFRSRYQSFVLYRCVDRYEQRVQGGCEIKQRQISVRRDYNRGCSCCSILQQEVS